MDRKMKWRFRIMAGVQLLAAAAAVLASAWLLYRYVQYGERSAWEAGTRPSGGSGADAEPELQMNTEKTDARGSGSLPAFVRVRILGNGGTEEYHETAELTCEKPLSFSLLEKTSEGEYSLLEEYRAEAGTACSIQSSDLREGQALCAVQEDGLPITVTSLMRADGHPQYCGKLFLYREPEGLALVNEVPLEEYLCGVVSSEMPSDYPMEAQKAQAVCARTYACICVRRAKEKNTLADLDDSVNDQVYNNYLSTRNSRRAAEETEGEILPLEEIQYYSTSCQTEHRTDLGSEESFRDFLAQEPDADAEYGSPWLRWETRLPERSILSAVEEIYGWRAEQLERICVSERGGDGQAQILEVCCGGRSLRAAGEYRIRQVLSPGSTPVRLADGQKIQGLSLLPSAFFWMESGAEDGTGSRYVAVHGGGYGHGRGMSQYGAAALAEKGMGYREILAYYYGTDGTE